MDSKVTIAKKYISYLSKGDLKRIVSLFSEDGEVDSPLYGRMNVYDFYEELLSDTTKSELEIKGVFEDDHSVALYFNYKWELKNKDHVAFDVIDIIQFDDQLKIKSLKIIYDTSKSREALNKFKKA